MSDRGKDRQKVNPAAAAEFEARARAAAAAELRKLDPEITEAEITERLARASGTIVGARVRGLSSGMFPKVERITASSDAHGIAKVNRWLPGAAVHGGRKRGTNSVEEAGGEPNVRRIVAEMRRQRRKVTAGTVAATSGQFTPSQLTYWLRANGLRLEEL